MTPYEISKRLGEIAEREIALNAMPQSEMVFIERMMLAEEERQLEKLYYGHGTYCPRFTSEVSSPYS